MVDNECNCNYSYICPPCQEKIDLENQQEYVADMNEWMLKAMKAIGEQLNIALPPPPEKRGRYQSRRY